MSLDFDYYSARQRQPYRYNQNDKTMPVSQQIISWGIALVFIFLVCDHGWWANALREREKKGDYPGTPQYEEALKGLSANNNELKERLASGTITPEEVAKFQYRGIECLSKMGQDWSNFSSGMYQESLEIYAKNWKLDGRNEWMKSHCKTETDRRTYARWDFERKFEEERNRLPRPECLRPLEIESGAILRLCLWIVKWYVLMTVPSVLIMLVGKGYDGLSIKEELLLQPTRLVRACLAGPIGVFSLSGVAAKVSSYQRLERQFLRDKPWGFQLNERQKEALWVQVYEPMLSFDQALEALRDGRRLVKKSLVVCALTWLLSLTYHQTGFLEESARLQVTMSSESPEQEQVDESPILKYPKSTEISSLTLMLLAILPSCLAWPDRKASTRVVTNSTTQPIQQCCWNPDKPRGPPSLLVRKQHASIKLRLSGLATVTEG